jgi:PD-(D/E)XK endonuclease
MGILRPTPKQKVPKGSQGTESEMIIATELVRAGYTVLTPHGYMHRYDLVIEDADGRFWKIQCKTAWLSTQTEGALVFAGCSTGGKGGWKNAGIEMMWIILQSTVKIQIGSTWFLPKASGTSVPCV